LTRKRERLELSRDESDAEEDQDDEEAREERTQICRAIDWKRRHFFVACMVVALFLMVKLEFSYSELFGKNILAFLVLFTVLDLILEQLLTRLLMSEALLVSPILGAIVTTEFIMTMGADDFQHFIVAYFTQTAIVVASRSYLGPWLEKLEAVAQRLMVSKSLQHPQLAQMAKSHLVRQLNW
jgi:cation transport ATPase